MSLSHNITNDKYFSTELEKLVITGATDVVTVAFRNTKGDTVYQAELTPDSVGCIIVYDLRSLFEAEIEEVFAHFYMDINGAEVCNFAIFKSCVALSESAVTFLPDFFLSTIAQKKTTSVRRETLSFYTDESCSVYALATFFFEGEIISKKYDILSSDDVAPGVITTIDVSSQKFLNPTLGQLVNYVVRAGNRAFSFEVDETLPTAEHSVLFKNAFDCWETMYLTGTSETNYDIKRYLAYIDGRYRAYDMDDVEIFKTDSGVLPDNMLAIGKDLARSRNVWLMDKLGNPDDEIVLTDCNIKYTDDDDALPSFEYTYRRSSLISAFCRTVRPPKLFDSTFDQTFN